MTSNNGQWTRDDLPSVWRQVDRTSFVLDAVVDHLNSHHPKPKPGWTGDALMAQARTIAGLQDERADALRQRDEWKARALDAEHYAQAVSDSNRDNAERASRAERERDAAVARAEQAERERDQAVEACALFQRDMHKWRERAEAAEARTAPAVTRAEVEKAIKGELVGSNVTLPDDLFELQIDAVCDLFGVEAEQSVDPVEAKAEELYGAANPGVSWDAVVESAERGNAVDGQVAREYRAIARHVLGQEADR